MRNLIAVSCPHSSQRHAIASIVSLLSNYIRHHGTHQQGSSPRRPQGQVRLLRSQVALPVVLTLILSLPPATLPLLPKAEEDRASSEAKGRGRGSSEARASSSAPLCY